MPPGMNHRERVLAALAGEEVDRPPVSMWRHYYGEERSAEGLAEAMLEHQRRYDWDFVKINPRWSYHVEPWGTKVRYDGAGAPVLVSTPVGEPADWERIEPVGLDHPVFAEQLRAIELIAEGLGGQAPYLATVFTPVAVASRLAPSDDALASDLREHPDRVNTALEAITETFIGFARAALERGASGLFYATLGFATTDRLTVQEYRRLVRPWDLKLLEALPETEFTVMHVCRERSILAALWDYPVQAFNWDAGGDGNPSLEEGKAVLGGKPVIGGVAHGTPLVQASPSELEAEIRDLRAAMGERGWMLGPGCTYPPETPEANLMAVRRALRRQRPSTAAGSGRARRCPQQRGTARRPAL